MVTLSFLPGTAFDFFISLCVLHNPRDFGLRPSWAAGVRSRIPLPWRATLEAYQVLSMVPLSWIASLPEPRDAACVIKALGAIPAEQRIPTLFLERKDDPDLRASLDAIARRGSCSGEDQETLRLVLQKSAHLKPAAAPFLCELWTRLPEAGVEYLGALQAYQDAFFSEEERRIAPAIHISLTQVKTRAETLAVEDLVEEVSKGVKLQIDPGLKEIRLAASYWGAPFLFFQPTQTDTLLLVYGARPEQASPSAEDPAPEALLRGLEALADPTRMRILRYLREQPLTPTELAARLRLRAPTVVHHLRQLRLAGLVRITLEAEAERRYALRAEALQDTWTSLQDYLRRP